MVKNYITHDAVQKFLLIRESKDSREYTHSEKNAGLFGSNMDIFKYHFKPNSWVERTKHFF